MAGVQPTSAQSSMEKESSEFIEAAFRSHRNSRPGQLLVLPPSLPDPRLLRLLSLESTPSPAQVPVLFSPAGLPTRPFAPAPTTPDYFNFAAAVQSDSGYFDSCYTDQASDEHTFAFGNTGLINSEETVNKPWSEAATDASESLLLTRNHLLALETNHKHAIAQWKDTGSFSSESSAMTSWYFSSTTLSQCSNAGEGYYTPSVNADSPPSTQENNRSSSTLGSPQNDTVDDSVLAQYTGDQIKNSLTKSQRASTRAQRQQHAGKAHTTTKAKQSQSGQAVDSIHSHSVVAQIENTEAAPLDFAPAVFSRGRTLGAPPAAEAFATSLDQLENHGGRPAYLWWTLIRAAILGAPDATLQMETLCQLIADRFPYFRTAKEARNWKSSIRSVIHTKPCFYKSEDQQGNVWWHVDVSIDPREQRRGMKRRTEGEGSEAGGEGDDGPQRPPRTHAVPSSSHDVLTATDKCKRRRSRH